MYILNLVSALKKRQSMNSKTLYKKTIIVECYLQHKKVIIQ